jgi:hypothetical protein
VEADPKQVENDFGDFKMEVMNHLDKIEDMDQTKRKWKLDVDGRTFTATLFTKLVERDGNRDDNTAIGDRVVRSSNRASSPQDLPVQVEPDSNRPPLPLASVVEQPSSRMCGQSVPDATYRSPVLTGVRARQTARPLPELSGRPARDRSQLT